ncbi:MAG: Gfo/Idh/MocA family protein [Burkholderiaceae bacterium]
MTLKVAMIGTGRIATMKLLPALNKAGNAQLWSVMSRDKARAAKVAAEFGAQSPSPAHGTLEALLADPSLDAVIIATPDKLHAEQAIAAANAGKHVFCEKPMTTSLEEADAMIAACQQAGVQLGVAFHLRWHEGHRKLQQAAVNGTFGTLRHIRVQWSSLAADDSNWRAASEVGKWWSLAGVGTHCLDQILWFMEPGCGKVVEVKSLISREVWKGPNDETALISLKFESGATADLCSSVVFAGPTQFELYGTEGFARGEGSVGIAGEGRIWTDKGDWSFEVVDPYQLEIEDFADAVRENRAPEVGGDMGRRNTEILLQASDG